MVGVGGVRVTLLGTGDTTGTPTVGCGCETCQEARERGVERSRFSVYVENERSGEAVLIDASPDFRQQFLSSGVDLPDSVVITHIHFDHLDGLGNAFRLFDELPVFAASDPDATTGESVAETIRSKYYYLKPLSVAGVASFERFRTVGLEIRLVPVDHPPLASYGVVVIDPETGGKLSITGDTSYAIPDASRKALAGADLLLANAIVPAAYCEYHPAGGQHPGPDGVPRTFGRKHMTREGALALAEEIDAGQVRLVHVAHYYPAEEAFEEPLAVDGEAYVL